MTKAYTQSLSIIAGDDLKLYVSTDAPQFRVEFYRLGITLAGPINNINVADIRIGDFTEDKRSKDDWSYKEYFFSTPENWSPGIYIAMLVEVDDSGVDVANQPLDRTTADGDDRKAMFIVRQTANNKRKILLKIPTATYQAYNYTGNGSTYRDGGNIASLRRPGNGTGGPTTFASNSINYNQVDVYDPSSDRMKVVHLEAKFIHWLETNGYAQIVDYCSDFDLHFHPEILDNHYLLLSVGT